MTKLSLIGFLKIKLRSKLDLTPSRYYWCSLFDLRLQIAEYHEPWNIEKEAFAPNYNFFSHPPTSVRRHWLRVIVGTAVDRNTYPAFFDSLDREWSDLRRSFMNAPFGLPHSEKFGLAESIIFNDIYFDSTCLKANIHFPTDWVLLHAAAHLTAQPKPSKSSTAYKMC